MEVYTNSSQVKELITTQTNIEVEPFDNHVPESKEVDVFLLDDHLLQLQDRYREDKACLYETTLLRGRSDWGGTILEMMKYNKHVHLLTDVGTVSCTILTPNSSSFNCATHLT